MPATAISAQAVCATAYAVVLEAKSRSVAPASAGASAEPAMIARNEHATRRLFARASPWVRTSSGTMLYFVGLKSALCTDMRKSSA